LKILIDAQAEIQYCLISFLQSWFLRSRDNCWGILWLGWTFLGV